MGRNLLRYNNRKVYSTIFFMGVILLTFSHCKVAKSKVVPCPELLAEIKINWSENAFRNFAYLNKRSHLRLTNQLDCFLGNTETEMIDILGIPMSKNRLNYAEYQYFIRKSKYEPYEIKIIMFTLDVDTGKIIKTLYGSYNRNLSTSLPNQEKSLSIAFDDPPNPFQYND